MQTAAPVHHKLFTFRTFTEWAGGRASTISADGKPTFRVASAPEFRGEPNVWTPEDLFIASIDTCLLITFAAIVQKQQIPVDAYYSESVGTLEFAEGAYRFTRVVVRPTIVLANEDATDAARGAIQRAHRECLVANSLLTTVIVEPEIRLRHAA